MIGTGLIMLIPLTLQLTIGTGVDGHGFNWRLGDFIVIGVMVFVTGLLIDLAWSKLGKHRALGTITVVVLFLWLYAELAVGIFTNLGS